MKRIMGAVCLLVLSTCSNTWQNLQVLPADMPHDDLIITMRQWSKSLGVQCEYCHVQLNESRDDFVSDLNPAKDVSREMLRMMNRINADIRAISKDGATVTCYTCHRGNPKP